MLILLEIHPEIIFLSTIWTSFSPFKLTHNVNHHKRDISTYDTILKDSIGVIRRFACQQGPRWGRSPEGQVLTSLAQLGYIRTKDNQSRGSAPLLCEVMSAKFDAVRKFPLLNTRTIWT